MNIEALSQAMDAFVATRQLPGYALEIWRDGVLLHIRTQGFADCENALPVTENSVFRLMSMTKPVIAVAVMMLAEQGKLALDTPVSRYVQPCPSEELTILHLLNHTSGWGMGEDAPYRQVMMAQDTLEGRVRGWGNVPLDFPLATRTGYSGMVAFDVLGYIIEQVSGQPLAEFLSQRLFQPLGMADTGFFLSASQRSRLVRLYCAEEEQLTDVTDTDTTFPYLDANVTGCCCGSAGLFGTLTDYSRFACMLAHQGSWNGAQILKPETVAAMATPTLPDGIALGPGMRWGLGMLVQELGTPLPLPVGTFGWSGAYGTHFWIDPVNKLTVVLMANVSNIGGAGSHVSRALEQLVYGV